MKQLEYLYVVDDGCGPDIFPCADGSCISISLLCNFRRDCEGDDDEAFCGNITFIF